MTYNSKKTLAFVSLLMILGGLFFWLNPEPSKIIETLSPKSEKEDFSRFVPHKALYNIKLAGTKSGSQIVNISGQMLYEWKPTCEAWVSNHRFNIVYEYADTPALNITSDFSTYEAFDGSSLNFTSQRKRNGELFEELRGRADIAEGQTGEAVFTIPESLKHELPIGTLFPIRHTFEVAKKVDEGAKFFNSVIYDGSDEDGAVEVNAFIGKELNASERFTDTSNMDMDLINTPAHAVRLAFFPLNTPEASSDYEMDLVFHENGIISDMIIDYDDFSVSQTLTAIEKIETSCGVDESMKEIKASANMDTKTTIKEEKIPNE